MAKLGEVCKVSPSTKNIERQGAWLLNLDMVEQQTGRVVEYNFVGEDGLNGSITQFDTENVLYSKLRPNLNKVVLPERNGFCTSELLPLRPDARKLDRSYLAVFLRSDGFVNWAVSKTAGAKMPRLGTKDLLNANIPLPEIKEQKAIAEKFEKLEELIFLRKQQIAKLDELVKARFVEMFGDPADNVNNLPASPMTAICQIIDGDRGKNYPKQEEFSDSGFCLFLNAKNVTAQGFSFENCTYITEEKDALLRNGKLCRGDVVLTTRGTIGNLAFYDTSVPYENIRINSGMVILRMNKQVVSEIFFIEQFKMQLDSIKSRIASGSAQPQLPISTMNKIEMILPPIEPQNQFSAFVERVDKQKQTVQQSLEKLELMKKALMQEYFG